MDAVNVVIPEIISTETLDTSLRVESSLDPEAQAREATYKAMSEVATLMKGDSCHSELWGHRSVIDTGEPCGSSKLGSKSAARIAEIMVGSSFGIYNWHEVSAEATQDLLNHRYINEAASIATYSRDRAWQGWDNGSWARFSISSAAALEQATDPRSNEMLAQGLQYLKQFGKDLRKQYRPDDSDTKNILGISRALADAGCHQEALVWSKKAPGFDSSRSILLRSLRRGSICWDITLADSQANASSKFQLLIFAANWLEKKGDKEKAQEALLAATSLLPENKPCIDLHLELARGWSILEPSKALAHVQRAHDLADQIDNHCRTYEKPPGWLEFDRRFSIIKVAKAFAQLSLKDEAMKAFDLARERSPSGKLDTMIAEAIAEAGYYDELKSYRYAELFKSREEKALYRAFLALAAYRQREFGIVPELLGESVELTKKIPYGRETIGLPRNDIIETLAHIMIEEKPGVSISSRWSSSVVADF